MKYGNQLNYGLAALALLVALFAFSNTLLSPLDVRVVLQDEGETPSQPPTQGEPSSALSLNPSSRPVAPGAEPVRPEAALPQLPGNRATAPPPAATPGLAPAGQAGTPRAVQPARPEGPSALPLNLSGAERRRSDPPRTSGRRTGIVGRAGTGNRSTTRPAGGRPSQSQGGQAPDQSRGRGTPAPPTRSSNQ